MFVVMCMFVCQLENALLTHLDACDTPGELQENITTASPSVTFTQPTNMSSKAAYDYTSQSTSTTATNITMTTTQSPSTESEIKTTQTVTSTQTIWPLSFSTTLNKSR